MAGKYGIGIDTGGTFTDAVIYDFDGARIVAAAKALTTKEDLSKGILEALDGLPTEKIKEASTVSLSTTLATNACVENKGGKANLILIGADKRVFKKVGSMYGLTDEKRILFVDMDEKAEYGQGVDWSVVEDYCDQLQEEGLPDAIGVVQLFARERNAAEEKEAKTIIENRLKIPVVCGHELHNDLNVFKRGAETMLNAGLISVIKSFLVSIKKSLNVREINTNVVIMRSDGTLMSETFTGSHPVETLLCGPAASVIGAQKMAQSENSVVIDMGGTTTDIAIIEKGLPVKVREGVQIGQWKTFVKGVFIDTFGLGGDSGIHIIDRSVDIKTERFIPLCILATQYPEANIVGKLETINSSVEYHTQPLTDFFVLRKRIINEQGFSKSEIELCRNLENGPLSYSEAAEIIGSDVYSLKVHRLEEEGYIMRAGLTPTDIMHVRGDFDKYDTRASMIAAKFAAKCMVSDVEKLCETVYDEIVKKLYCNIVRVGIENRYPEFAKNGVGTDLKRMIELAYEEAKLDGSKQMINTNFISDFDLVGIGAPIHVFLPEVAKLLVANCIIPENTRVGNAVGAVAGNIAAEGMAIIKPVTQKVEVDDEQLEGLSQFVVYASEKNKYFEKLSDAVAWGEKEAREDAVRKAKEQGAAGNLIVKVETKEDIGEAKDVNVYIGTKIVATAIGK